MHRNVKRNEPFGGFRVLVLRSEDFKPPPSFSPLLTPLIVFHCSDNSSLFNVVHVPKTMSETVDVEHGDIGYKGDYDDDVD